MHWTAEQITDDVQQKLQVNAEIKTNAWTFGWRMAHGLPEYLWACPACFSIESLKVSNGNYIQCQACHANWKIDIHTHLNGHTDTTVADAFDRIVAHFQFPPIVNHEQFNHEEIALESSEVCVIMKLNTGFHTIGQGLLQVTKDGLTLSHPTGTWHAKYEDIGAISVELANRLFINVSGIPHERVPKGSRYMWAYFIRQWKAFTLGSEL